MKSNKQFLGMAAALAANVIFGFSFVFSKLALSVAHPLVILAVRFTVAFLLMNILWLAGLLKLNFKNKPKGKLLAMAVAQPLLYFILELYGLKMVSSALSGIIIALVPVGVLVISTLFLRENPTKTQVFYTLVSIVGISAISILSNDGEKSYLLGVALLVGAVIAAAVFNILSRKEAEHYSPFERTYAMFFIATVGFNIIAFCVLGKGYFSEVVSAFQSSDFIIAIIYLSVLSSVAAFMLYNYSTSKISAVRSSSFSNIITVVSVLGGVIILKEKFSILELLLCIPVILGVWGVNYQKEKA
ncbi:MAG: DMT family transporter [Ruminococcaceae bacterium]|nr:DMT family transporter [Oscillospiraceae bacterium]